MLSGHKTGTSFVLIIPLGKLGKSVLHKRPLWVDELEPTTGAQVLGTEKELDLNPNVVFCLCTLCRAWFCPEILLWNFMIFWTSLLVTISCLGPFVRPGGYCKGVNYQLPKASEYGVGGGCQGIQKDNVYEQRRSRGPGGASEGRIQRNWAERQNLTR